MKTHQSILLFASLLTSSLAADTIELKSGSSYQGKVISEDDKSYLLEIHHSSSIKDKRRIPKDQVKQIISEAKDAQDFQHVKSSTPTPDGLSEKNYTARIQRASDFLKKHPKSTHIKEVNAILEILNKENAVVSKGGIKLDGALISASDIEANSYDIHARIILNKAKKLTKTGNYQLSLREWERLQQNYPHSAAYKDNLSLTTRILKIYQKELTKKLDSLESRTTRRKVAIESLEPNDRKRSEVILTEKDALYASLIEKEEKQIKTKWLTIDPFNQKALEYNLRSTETSLKKIASTSPTKFKLAGPDLRGAWSALAKNDLEEVDLRLKSLQPMRLPAEYLDPITTQLTEKRGTQAAEKKATEEAAAQAKAAEAQALKDAKEAAAKKKKGKKK